MMNSYYGGETGVVGEKRESWRRRANFFPALKTTLFITLGTIRQCLKVVRGHPAFLKVLFPLSNQFRQRCGLKKFWISMATATVPWMMNMSPNIV